MASNSPSPQPRWNEAPCNCARRAASRRVAGSTTAVPPLHSSESHAIMVPAAAALCAAGPLAAWRRARADKRTGRRGLRTDRGAEPRHPGNIGRRLRIDLERRRRIGRPAVGENVWRHCRPDAARRNARRSSASVDRRDLRLDQRAAVAAHHLEINLVMPRIDRGDDRMLAVLADDGRGIGGQRGQPDHRLVGGKRNAARGGKSDAQSGEAAGAGGHRDAVERGERDAGSLSSRARSAASALRHGRASSAAIPARSVCPRRCRARRRRRHRARYRWRGSACGT